MPQLVLTLLKINLVLLLFAAVYFLFLRKLTFYNLNRVFLLFGITFSSVYPFLDLTRVFEAQQAIPHQVAAYVPNVQAMVPVHTPGSGWQILLIGLYVGAACMAFRLGLQLLSLYRIHKRSQPGKLHNQRVRLLHDALSPFSFWQTIYLNPGLHQKQELETIISHEQVHVREWHTVDILLAELSLVFYWFNPGVWLMKKAVKENIEFITDARLLNRGLDRKTYQYSLLGAGSLAASVPLVHHFNLSDLKTRIRMMNAKRSPRFKIALYVVAVPLLICTTLAFTISVKSKRPVRVMRAVPTRQPESPAVQVQQVWSAGTAKKRTIRAAKPAAETAHAQPDSIKPDHIAARFFVTTDSLPEEVDRPAILVAARQAAANLAKDESARVFLLTDSITTLRGKVSKVRITYLKKEGVPAKAGAPESDKRDRVIKKIYHYRDSIPATGVGMIAFPANAGLPQTARGLKPEDIRSIRLHANGAGERRIEIELNKP